ncbi:YncE family protein [Dyadobacter diqingensis]|uniref:YncE family protein n=1 Tax=Dyadobacter diqingensis TaxID=2938121 RepID=UPI0020C4DE39|nr:hypothetical protein [Dyadobacter diqingensis]
MKYIVLFAGLILSHLSLGQTFRYVLVLSKAEKKLVALDYKSLDIITKVSVSEDPHEIVTTPDGSLAYISHPLMNGNGHEIDVVNLKTMKPRNVIDTKPFYIPHGLVYLNEKLWFTAQGSKSVAVFDTRENKIAQVFGTGQDFTHLLHVNADGNSFYTTNVESGTVSIFEKKNLPPYMPPTGVLPVNTSPRLEWRQTLVNVGPGSEGFDVSSDRQELWTARPDGKIVIVDLIKKEVKAEINTQTEGLHRLKITPDGKTVCVVSVKTGDLLYYNKVTHILEQKDKIGQGAGIFMDGESNRMFISCTPNNKVVVIDLVTRKEIKRIDIGRPDGITAVLVK